MFRTKIIALSKNRHRFVSNMCNKNECKCPNSAKIDNVERLVLPTFFLSCGIGGYIVGDIIFKVISFLNH